jgi:hypothetical protein
VDLVERLLVVMADRVAEVQEMVMLEAQEHPVKVMLAAQVLILAEPLAAQEAAAVLAL